MYKTIPNIPNIVQKFTNYNISPLRGVLMGLGIKYAIENKKHEQLIFPVLMPGVYIGYHLFIPLREWINNI